MASSGSTPLPPSQPSSVPPLAALALPHLTAAGLSQQRSEPFLRALNAVVQSCAANGLSIPATWQHVACSLLRPDVPFPVHELLYSSAFATWRERALGPPPVWTPTREEARQTNLGRLLGSSEGRKLLGKAPHEPLDLPGNFLQLQRLSYGRPELYWPIVLRHLGIIFRKPPQKIFSLPEDPKERLQLPGGRWLVGAELNIAESCLGGFGRRGRGNGGESVGEARGEREGERVAVVWRDEWEEGAPVRHMTIGELRQQAIAVAQSLQARGVRPGEAIALALPMTVQSVAAYLGVLLIGAAVVSIADSFSAREIAARLKIAGATAIVTQDFIPRGGKLLPLYSRVVEAGAPPAIVLPATEGAPRVALREGDVWWSSFLAEGQRSTERGTSSVPCVSMPVDASINILFSSGTTGTPKAIPWSALAAIKAAADAWAHHDLRGVRRGTQGPERREGAHYGSSQKQQQQQRGEAGDVVCWPTSLGWMMGPWLLFAALLNGATVALYNGSPLTHGFARFVQDARVTVLGVVPSLVRSWKASGCTDACDWSHIRLFSSTGEASLPSDYLWLMARARYQAPILEYCGGTEIAGAFLTGTLLQPQALSCFSTPAMGCRAVLLGAEGDGGGGVDGGSGGGARVVDPGEWRKGGGSGAGGMEGDDWLMGECALMPRMLGASWKLLNADHYRVYFEGMPEFHGQRLRRHGDAVEWGVGGYWRAHGRTDDTMNLGGVKVGSVEVERVCNTAHPAVSETAAIGVAPRGGGPEELVVVAVMRGGGVVGEKGERSGGVDGAERSVVSEDDLRKVFSAALQAHLNPLFKVSCSLCIDTSHNHPFSICLPSPQVAAVWVVPSLPRNASNKVMRRVLRDLFTRRHLAVPSTTTPPTRRLVGTTGRATSRL
ncbi:unnamed protein product [Closterium sp. NIES-64]|nr:unnamed protein product [Closterium sp. NIES-64]